jgi:sporulation integral membrane protein YlbJ
VGAIGIGMFANPSVGYLLATSHYLSNLLIGWLWRFKVQKPKLPCSCASDRFQDPVFTNTNENDENIASMGKILGDAVKNALNNILAVGGFIIIFSVLTRMLSYWGFIDMMASGLVKLCTVFHLSYPLAYGLSMGFFEITMGAKTAVAASSPEALPTLLVVSSILAFSGLSIIAQIMSIVAGTPVRLSFYLLARTLQVVLSAAITCVVYRFFLADSISTMGFAPLPIYKVLYSFNAWAFSLYSMLVGLILILIMIGLAWRKKY